MTVNVTTKLEFHPIAEAFPLMTDEEFAGLVGSIKTQGLLEPITIHEGKILDGRHRYRACHEAGVEPRAVEFDGDDPVEFATGKNIHHRNLTKSQKAMVFAKLAKMPVGRPNSGMIPLFTNAEAAKMAHTGIDAIWDAKTVLAEGTPEEIAAVENRKEAVFSMADKIRARRPGKEPKTARTAGGAGPRAAAPDGTTITALARQGIELERAHELLPAVMEKIGLSSQTYKIARDAVLLSERDDLSRAEMRDVKAALSELDDNRRPNKAAALVAPIAERVWGPKGMRFKKMKSSGDARRVQRFIESMTFLLHSCENAVDILIPPITRAQATKAANQLTEARQALKQLHERIHKGVYHDD